MIDRDDVSYCDFENVNAKTSPENARVNEPANEETELRQKRGDQTAEILTTNVLYHVLRKRDEQLNPRV